MSVCCECCVLSARGHCDKLITRPEESHRLWFVVVCDLENLVNEEALTHWGLSRQKQTHLMTPDLFKPDNFLLPDFGSIESDSESLYTCDARRRRVS
jgi:hypothetical protein